MFRKKKQREKNLRWFHMKTREIKKCIKENSPEFRYCYGCKMIAKCNRIQKKMGV